MSIRGALVGRTIVDVRLNRFYDGVSRWGMDPELVLDNGRIIRFVTQETEGNYGVRIIPVRMRRSKSDD